MNSPSTVLPQGPILSGMLVELVTTSIGPGSPPGTYVYAQDGATGSFQFYDPTQSTTNVIPIQFRVGVTTDYITLTAVGFMSGGTTVTLGLTYDNTGRVSLSPDVISLPIHMNQTSYTALEEPASVTASLLYDPVGTFTNTNPGVISDISLQFLVGSGSMTSYEKVRIALVPITVFVKNNGCNAVTNPYLGLNLFSRTYFPNTQVPPGTPTAAWTTLRLCNTGVTFELCPSGTYCNGRCYSACQTPGQVCVPRSGLGSFVCTSSTTTTPTFTCPTTSMSTCPTTTSTSCPMTTGNPITVGFPSTSCPTNHHTNHNTTTTNNSIPNDIFVHHSFTGAVPSVASGVGTVSVRDNNGGNTSSTWWIWIIFAVVLFLIIIMVVYFMFWSQPSHVDESTMYATHHLGYA